MIDYRKGPTLRFKLCNLIYKGYFKDVFAFDQASLDIFIKYGTKFGFNEYMVGRLDDCVLRLNYLIGKQLKNVVSEDGKCILIRRKAFIIADWLYDGYLSTMLPRIIPLLRTIANVVRHNEFKLTPDCVKGLQMVIEIYERIML